jgi:transposase InsO family protein
MDRTYGSEEQERETQPPRGLARRRVWAHPFELRLKAVKLRLEEGFPLELVARELGVGYSTISAWVKRYREHGEQGLRGKVIGQGHGRAKLAPVVKQKITELKQQHPHFGVKRIAQVLRRVLLLPGSHETVRRTLQREHLIQKTRTKPRRNPPKPRFFERSTPNQMWQSDIFTFRLGGKNAYLIGFIDDYSRYVVGLDLFRSQSAEHVLEVYRTAVAEYGVPKEMLTDNGRQYTAWRGHTRFEQELQKDRIHHIRSRPHHPMTLGKIERFWKTIWEEFLVRAQFDSFEQARERVRLWVKYYNHKRPHQSLEGLCPADRFFAIAQELRQTIERGIADNVLELALRGQPRSPFYMVGRLGEQSVVIRAEKGQVKMLIDGQETVPAQQEVRCDLHPPTAARQEVHEPETTTEVTASPGATAGPTDCAGPERLADSSGSGAAIGGVAQDLLQVAETGVSGDGASAGRSGGRPSRDVDRPREGGAPATDPAVAGQTAGVGADAGDPSNAGPSR